MKKIELIGLELEVSESRLTSCVVSLIFENCGVFEQLNISSCGARGGAGKSVGGGGLYLTENQSMAIKFERLFVVAVVLALGVFALDFDGGYGITDCGVKVEGSVQ